MTMWYCDGCQEAFSTEVEALEHETTCPQAIDFEAAAEKRRNEEEKWTNQLKKDRLDNPHLSLISDALSTNNDILHITNSHLWWLALIAKITLIALVLQFLIIFALLGV